MTYLLVIPLVVLLGAPAFAQVTCFDYSRTVSCDGPGMTNRTITRFNDRQGVITDERGNLEPYTIMPNRRDEERRSEERRRDLIYGEPRRDSTYNRSRSSDYGEEYGK